MIGLLIPTQTSLEGAILMYASHSTHIVGIKPFQGHPPFNQEDK